MSEIDKLAVYEKLQELFSMTQKKLTAILDKYPDSGDIPDSVLYLDIMQLCIVLSQMQGRISGIREPGKDNDRTYLRINELRGDELLTTARELAAQAS